METDATMTNDDLLLLSELTFFHGTTKRKWEEEQDGMHGGLFLTSSPTDALNYAEEAGIGEYSETDCIEDSDRPESVVVSISGRDLIQLMDETPMRSALEIEPDWGWSDGLQREAQHENRIFVEPDWRQSLKACFAIHLLGFCHDDKKVFSVSSYEEFEANHLEQASFHN